MPRTTEGMKAAWADPAERAKMSKRPKIEARNAQITETGVVDCGRCKQTKALSEFPESRKTRKGQPRYSYCKVCHSAVQRALRLKKLFDLTEEQYELMLKFQNGVCFICLQPPKKVRLAIDHDHKTGLVRGLLCAFCNRGVGVFRDNLEKFEKVVEYLKNPPATQAFGAPHYGIKGRVTNKAKTMRRMNKDMFDRPKVKE